MFDKHTGNGNGNKMNVRLNVLEGLLASFQDDGNMSKANALKQVIRRNKVDMGDTATKSLDLMRRIFQQDITTEIRQIIDRYLNNTFSPAIENLRRNGHEVGENEINKLSWSILDAVKESFGPVPPSRKRGLRDDAPFETDNEDEVPTKRRFAESEDESDGSVLSFSTVTTDKKRRRPRSKKDEEAILNDASAIKLTDTIKWNPERFSPASRFLFASRVAATLNMPPSLFFSKYPRFFRYVCEEEDKLELYDAGRLSRLTGRAVLVLLEDAFEVLGQSPEIERYSFPIGDNIYRRLRERAARVHEALCQRLTSSALNNAAAALFPFGNSPLMATFNGIQ